MGLIMEQQHMDGVEDERTEELSSISAIFPELVLDPAQPFEASLDIPVNPTIPLGVNFSAATSLPTPPPSGPDAHHGALQASPQHRLSYLPPLHLKVVLPAGYPEQTPPVVSLSTDPSWLPRSTVDHLQKEVEVLWEDYGHGQTVFAYIDFLQQAAERAFDLPSDSDAVKLDPSLRVPLLNFDATVRREKFENATFDCGVCLEPKKGAVCYQLLRCGHVFCKECLQDYYNNAIKEGDVGSVTCLDPDCGRDKNDRSKKPHTLPPGELLLIPIERRVVQRYVDMKRKKKFDTDKSTVYCPRQWCQGPSRSNKVPRVEITRMETWDDDDNEPKPQQKASKEPEDPGVDRLRICDDCSYAFCRTCLQGWHGEFVKCWEDAPLSEEELAEKLANRPMTEEDRLSYELILKSTSACPMCGAAIQKSHGCNHMTCNQCGCHFCYLCNTFLDPRNPYPHFGQKGTPCYQKLFELVEGDDGDENAQALRVGAPRHYEIMALLYEADREAEAEAAAAAPANAEQHDLADNLQQLRLNADGHDAREPAPPPGPAEPPPAELQPAPAPRPPFRERLAGLPRRRRLPPHPDHNGGLRPHRLFPNARAERRALEEFVAAAAEDREDEWDSDDLEGEDGEWVIRDAEEEGN